VFDANSSGVGIVSKMGAADGCSVLRRDYPPNVNHSAVRFDGPMDQVGGCCGTDAAESTRMLWQVTGKEALTRGRRVALGDGLFSATGAACAGWFAGIKLDGARP